MSQGPDQAGDRVENRRVSLVSGRSAGSTRWLATGSSALVPLLFRLSGTGDGASVHGQEREYSSQ